MSAFSFREQILVLDQWKFAKILQCTGSVQKSEKVDIEGKNFEEAKIAKTFAETKQFPVVRHCPAGGVEEQKTMNTLDTYYRLSWFIKISSTSITENIPWLLRTLFCLFEQFATEKSAKDGIRLAKKLTKKISEVEG